MQHETSKTGAEPAERTKAPPASLCHQTAGRFRVRIRERRNDEAYLRNLRETLKRHTEVIEVETTSLTGSVLVLHRGSIEEILGYAENAGLFRVRPAEGGGPPFVRMIEALERFDSDFVFARMNEQPERAATGLVLLAVVQVLRGSVIPSAPSLLAAAMALLREARQRAEQRDG